MAGNILQIGTTALQAYQRALATTGHNVANAHTPGFSRQDTIFNTQREQFIGGVFSGRGVQITDIRRIANEFVTNQLRLDTASFFQLNAFDQNIRQLDSVLADETTGLSVGLDKFFNAMQAASENPTSIPARQLVLTEAEGLATRFNTLFATFEEQNQALNTEIEALIGQVSSLAAGIAELNLQISSVAGSSTAGQPNDLLDKRDELLRELSEIVGVQVVRQDDNTINVFIGKGQALVLGSSSAELITQSGGANNEGLNVVVKGTSQPLNQDLTGGTLGGLITYRDKILDPSFTNLGLVAVGLAKTVNDQQRMGLDLTGSFGERIFNDVNDRQTTLDRVFGDIQNALPVDRVLSLVIKDVQQIQASDYTFNFPGPDNFTYSITRNSDGVIVKQGSISGSFPETLEFDGLELTLESGSFQGGDTFFLQPTRRASRDFTAVMGDPRELAFAAAIRTLSSTTNQGTGSISQGDVFQVYDQVSGALLPAFATSGQLSPPIIIKFTSLTTYDVLDNSDPANPKQLVPPIRNQVFVPGTQKNVFTTDVNETIGSTQQRGTGSVGFVTAPVINPVAPNPVNNYPVQNIDIFKRDPTTGVITTTNVTTVLNASAQEIANQLTQVDGVTANAFNQVELRSITGAAGSAMEFFLNGEDLTNPALGPVPTPDTNPLLNQPYIQFLADRVNNNGNLTNQGIRAVVSESGGPPPIPTLKIFATTGVDLDVGLRTSIGAGSVEVTNGEAGGSFSSQTLDGAVAGAGNQHVTTIGGSIDVTMADGVTMRTTPVVSNLFGDTASFNFAQKSFKGYQVTVQGRPQPNDTFTIDFNSNGTSDNRNGFKLANLSTDKTLFNGTTSYAEGYAQFIEFVGVNASQADIDKAASETLLAQTEGVRQSESGVNLDEEASNLIRFQQAYNASAQLVNVARELFDTLLNSV
ncbi:flagellar hook-associated protein FlgK [Endozoicomonas sp. SM1973]|uniref:Flagellar hook-associated protein 1 n=1 Tax=Spartinivicinus marinus TaxID=2994442 RepID=A0A853I3V5_9GAMM|nr:flagellar hook-associated protein FlgK [Spartinivicinus marinus]MCX4029902.1 flagellar hook-associated protein FlgK [Spartinivicinus marinus]NYZ64854.1 flagellar hook-associated protein FlgK [Spartinivicinus marinus]